MEKLKNDETFNLFWEQVEMHRATFDDPILPRKRKCPQRFDDGLTAGDHATSLKVFFRQQCFEALDLIQGARESLNSLKKSYFGF